MNMTAGSSKSINTKNMRIKMPFTFSELKSMLSKPPSNAVFYGAGHNMALVLDLCKAMGLVFSYDIWDINAENIVDLKGHKVVMPNFQSFVTGNPTMIVTIGKMDVASNIVNQFSALGWNAVVAADGVWDTMYEEVYLAGVPAVPVQELLEKTQSMLECSEDALRIVYMGGGLGNQVFQYAFIRYLEESTNSQVLVDDSYFYLGKEAYNNSGIDKDAVCLHNGYELDYVFPYAKKPSLLSRYFEPNVWKDMISKAYKDSLPSTSVVRQLQKNTYPDLSIVIERGCLPAVRASFSGVTYSTLKLNTDLDRVYGNVFFYGHWVTLGYFDAYKEVLKKDLTFRPIESIKNQQYAHAISSSLAVGVHIRRGDTVKLNNEVPASYYKRILTGLQSKIPDAVYYVFSDDIEWCRTNMEQLGLLKRTTVFIEGNCDHKNNYIDMQLMAMCKVLVYSYSTFSHSACLLNQVDGFYAINSLQSTT